MKKVFLAALLLVSISGFSQKFQLGIKAGANVSNFTGTVEDVKTKSLVGFYGGVFTSFYVGNHFAIQPEVLISTQGAKIESVSTGEKQDFKLTYLTIPVMAKFEFNGGFYLETGPEAGINISGANFGDRKVKDVTTGADFLWGFGLGYHAPFGLGIGARYNLGLSKIGNANFNNADYKNSVIQIGLFYTIFNNKLHE
jgi:hypothetical protein